MGDEIGLALEHDLLLRVIQQNKDRDPKLFEHIENTLMDFEDTRQPKKYESFLSRQTAQLRTAFYIDSERRVRGHMQTPSDEKAIILPSGQKLTYSYARSATCAFLEEKIATNYCTQTDELCDGILFSSGTAAINALLHLMVYNFSQIHQRSPAVAIVGDYFETLMIGELLSNYQAKVSHYSSITDIPNSPIDILLIEPIHYNWGLEGTDYSALLSFWREVGAPSYVIVDSTLTPESWGKYKILKKAREYGVGILCDVRSGLKQDQFGLELANVGIVEVYQLHDKGDFSGDLRKVRAIYGTALSPFECVILDNSFFLNREWLNTHVALVAKNNSLFAEALAPLCGKGIFRSIAHPALLKSASINHAPFSVLKLQNDGYEDYMFLLGVLYYEAHQRNIEFTFGGSFGFRGHRYDAVIPFKRDLRCIMKIAIGSRAGVFLREIINLIQEISSFESMQGLRENYRMVKPVELEL
ncbi:hypothetical protein HMPREF9156_00710 [Scardovia wiggsiae F0424]|uniref:Aminotransferase class I/classII domain-containing protein n=1 Tax=Scardovia wiggsiae F0424 TaxID=857290 RepID=J0D4D6_9BIFI|nr:hypothetical protein [Scardovia wiggsiae]EJD64835.1 hypothetical protein HMPREF9156_00710 [Scardovia wiggsiae F0424]